jgi:glycosyltransferase involved in cell wall biosynthesis
MIKNFVSIIIPFYNNHDTINETLTSAFSQSHPNIEVILIDDGSIIPYKKTLENQNFKHFRQENKGVSAARNHGAKMASGEYLLFLDADDLIDSRYVEKCLNEFSKNKNVKIVYANAMKFGHESQPWILPDYKGFENFLIENCIYISALIKKSDFDQAQGFDENLIFYEDWDLWISILKNGGEVIKIAEPLFFYRIHAKPESASGKAIENPKIHHQNRLKVFVKHYDVYEKHIANFEHIFLFFIEQKNKKNQSFWTKFLK